MPAGRIQAFVPGPIKQKRVPLPEGVSGTKVILYKIRLRPGEPWIRSGGSGFFDPASPNSPGPIRVPSDLDIDEVYADGMSLRKHIHLRLTGLLERRYGRFIHQESDQIQSTTVVQEIPEREWQRNADRIWSQFLRSEGDGR